MARGTHPLDGSREAGRATVIGTALAVAIDDVVRDQTQRLAFLAGREHGQVFLRRPGATPGPAEGILDAVVLHDQAADFLDLPVVQLAASQERLNSLPV